MGEAGANMAHWSGLYGGGGGGSSNNGPDQGGGSVVTVSSPTSGGSGGGTSPARSAPGVEAGRVGKPARRRSRASRRAPVTLLNTDTSNFRAMVQEFTGIPNPPFAAGAGAGASFLSRSFDHIFPSTSTLRSAAGADPAASSLPPYLLRPFAQKLQTAAPSSSPFPPFTSQPSSAPPSSSNIGVANANANATTGNTASQRADDFQLTSSALLRMQQQDQSSSYLSFQNLLGSTQPSSQQHMFGMSHAATRLPDPSPSEFMAGIGGGGGTSIGFTHGGMMVSEAMHMHPRNEVHEGGGGGDELSGVVRAGSSGCKLNYTSHAGASSSSAAASTDMPPDGASRPSRGEGLDPWLCTSE